MHLYAWSTENGTTILVSGIEKPDSGLNIVNRVVNKFYIKKIRICLTYQFTVTK